MSASSPSSFSCCLFVYVLQNELFSLYYSLYVSVLVSLLCRTLENSFNKCLVFKTSVVFLSLRIIVCSSETSCVWPLKCLSPFLEMSLASSSLRLARVSGSVSPACCCLRVRLVERTTRCCPLKLVSSCEGIGLSSVSEEEERGRAKQEAESAARITHIHTPLFILRM